MMTRLLVLAALLSPCPCRAALARPVQLSLSFGAPAPVAILPSPPLSRTLSAVPAFPAPPALAPSFVPAPAPVLAAFHSGDAPAYLKAARAESYEPPEGDEHQTALYRLGLEREAAERAVRALGRAEAPAARATAIDYEEFGRQLGRHPGLSLDPFRHADAKRLILKASGYSRIHGKGGAPIPLERAADIRVGKTFANVLRAFERR